jgi:hypothetical protein
MNNRGGKRPADRGGKRLGSKPAGMSGVAKKVDKKAMNGHSEPAAAAPASPAAAAPAPKPKPKPKPVSASIVTHNGVRPRRSPWGKPIGRDAPSK